LSTIAKIANISLFIAHHIQDVPLMVYLAQDPDIFEFEEQWLHSIIPSALSVSPAGYSFFSPLVIGELLKPFHTASNHWFHPDYEDELYIRFTQISALMPSMLFEFSSFDRNQTDLVKKCISLHREHSKLIIDLAKKRFADSSPIIRPMWYAEPEDSKAFTIDDQFMLGDDIFVAPVVHLGQHERMVYMPSG